MQNSVLYLGGLELVGRRMNGLHVCNGLLFVLILNGSRFQAKQCTLDLMNYNCQSFASETAEIAVLIQLKKYYSLSIASSERFGRQGIERKIAFFSEVLLRKEV